MNKALRGGLSQPVFCTIPRETGRKVVQKRCCWCRITPRKRRILHPILHRKMSGFIGVFFAWCRKWRIFLKTFFEERGVVWHGNLCLFLQDFGYNSINGPQEIFVYDWITVALNWAKRVLPQYSLACFLHQAQGGFLFLSADTGFPQWTFFCGVSPLEREEDFWGAMDRLYENFLPPPSGTFFYKLFGFLSLACSFYPCLKVYFEIKCIFAHEIVMRKEDSNIEWTFCDTAVLPGAWWQSSP